MDQDFTIGIDIGGTNIKAAKVRNKEILGDVVEYKTPDNINDFKNLLHQIVRSFSDNPAIDVGLSIPGDIDYTKQYLRYCPNLPYLIQHNLSQMIDLQNVSIANDADMALLGEIITNDYSNQNLALITLGTGVGSSYYIAGTSPWSANLFSELGHTKVANQKRQCHCGNYDCLETYFSGWSLLNLAHDDGIDVENIEELFNSVNNNIGVKNLINDAIQYLAIGMSDLVNTTGITSIILSGKISKSYDLFIDSLKQKIEEYLHPSHKNRLVITKSNYIDKAAIIGAANFQIDSKKINRPAVSL